MLRRMLAVVMLLTTLLGVTSPALATGADPETQSDDATPPRLSYTAGPVSFWRPGGDDWAPAQVNTPLAEGDELYTARDGNLELQVGPRAFVRAWGDTQLGLTNQESNFMQLRVAAGHVALDLRTLDPGEAIEVATPAAAFTVDQPGYYRIDVTAERTSFVTRRSGRATVTTESGPAPAVAPGEAVVVEAGTVRRLAAPEPDVWDRWNDTRTAALVAPVSSQHVPAQVYGVNELDRYGTWRTEPSYGSVWVPANVAPGWVPYSTGRWIWDPRFGWTWLDTAPWGWAPYHYGRWVWLGNTWAWAPGPVIVRPAYSPALVAFYGTPAVGVAVVGPSIGWVALGWGEPVVPWWGRPHFVGRPWWGGWGGPRVRHVTVHRNVTVVNAVVVVRSDQFGRRGVREARIARPDIRQLQPVHGRLDVRPEPESFRGRDGRAQRPPEGQVSRRVVATRPPVQRPDPFNVREDRRDGRGDDRRDGRGDERRDGRPDGRGDERRDARPDDRRDATPGGQRPTARPDVPRDPERDRRQGAPRPEAPPRPQTPRAEPQRPDDPRGETPRVERRRPDTPRPDTPRRPDAPGVDAPRGEPRRQDAPRVDAPRSEPRVEPRRPEVPRVDTPRVETPRTETPRVETPRVEPPRRQEPPRPPAPPRQQPPRPEQPGVEPRRQDIPRGEPRGEPRVQAPRPEPPRRAAAPESARRPEAVRPAAQHRPEPGRAAAPARPARPERGEQPERGRQAR